MFRNLFFFQLPIACILKIKGYRLHYKISRWIFPVLPSLQEKIRVADSTLCVIEYLESSLSFVMGKINVFYRMQWNESLLGGMGGSCIRYSKVEPHWSVFWSNYIDIQSLKKCIACSLWIFSKTFFLNQSSVFLNLVWITKESILLKCS